MSVIPLNELRDKFKKELHEKQEALVKELIAKYNALDPDLDLFCLSTSVYYDNFTNSVFCNNNCFTTSAELYNEENAEYSDLLDLHQQNMASFMAATRAAENIKDFKAGLKKYNRAASLILDLKKSISDLLNTEEYKKYCLPDRALLF